MLDVKIVYQFNPLLSKLGGNELAA